MILGEIVDPGGRPGAGVHVATLSSYGILRLKSEWSYPLAKTLLILAAVFMLASVAGLGAVFYIKATGVESFMVRYFGLR